MSMYDDVGDFHRRFELPAFPSASPPRLLTDAERAFRQGFLLEELAEFFSASGCSHVARVLEAEAKSIVNQTGPRMIQSLPDQVDALLDLVYIALGTLHLMGADAEAHWAEIQRANMTKERAVRPEQSKRGSTLDVFKPDGWTPPDNAAILRRCGWIG